VSKVQEVQQAQEWLDTLDPPATSPANIPWEQMTTDQRRIHLLLRGGYRLEVVARTHGYDSRQYAETLDIWSRIIRNDNNVSAEF